MRVVYIDDWLFGAFVSLLMNYLLLWATGRILKKTQTRRRLFFAALLGGVYYFFLCYRIELGSVGNREVLFFLGTGLLMLRVAFPLRSVNAFLRTVGLFILLLLLTSGITYFLMYPPFFARPVAPNPWQVVFINILSLLIVTELGWGLVHQLLLEKECLFSLRLSVNGVTKEFSALLDTGNTLIDPLTKEPVLVVEAALFQGVLPGKILTLSQLLAEGGFPDNKALDFSPEWAARLRFISYTSVGKKSGFLLGFRPDEVCLVQKEPKRLPPVVIGLYHLTALSRAGNYQALLPASILNEVY
ncbi:MAG TPA: sigma-E processing peptidase SpoIIGA [Firmicutes bacterium]|jgi:stage II sporulation protein GA (sporulation sigma-E factor processing peptidase)|nr:sigma-E processing peptidase SpoIIGA [Bacillota bacterium]